MAKAKIRVHNQGKREYTIPPEKEGGKKRMILPGRAIELEKKIAEKMIKAYPHDLVEFDSLVSGEKKNLSKENARLESENSTYLEKIKSLEEEVQTLVDNIPETDKAVSEENQSLKRQIDDLEKYQDSSTGEELLALNEENKTLGDRVIDLELFIENSGLEVPEDENKEG